MASSDVTVLTCAVCGRTLLPGEQAETYLVDGQRRSVCELCTGRAVHQGWIRESAELDVGGRPARGDDRRPLLGRLRARRERRPGGGENGGGSEAAPRNGEPAGEETPRGERHVHAIPTSGEMKAARALELFNASEHPRTVAGVARSLGAPAVAVRPAPEHPSVVTVVVSWELCWYRYEVELADGGSNGVRVADQGYELAELADEDRGVNATADEHGTLVLAG
jgi:hypothetical protein